jgi:hypothetical protein
MLVLSQCCHKTPVELAAMPEAVVSWVAGELVVMVAYPDWLLETIKVPFPCHRLVTLVEPASLFNRWAVKAEQLAVD